MITIRWPDGTPREAMLQAAEYRRDLESGEYTAIYHDRG